MKVTFTIEYNTCWGESLALVLNDVKYPMAWGEGGKWSVTLNVRAADLKEYGYVVMRDGVIQRMEWSSHSSALPSRSPKTIADKWIDCPYPGCPFVRRHQVEKFDRPGFRGAGVVVPVFSLRTSEDFGIGEFCDLKAVVDWAAATGLCIIQLLPVTDTTRRGTWEDSYPYSPVSSFALHPLYLNLQKAGAVQDASFLREQAQLNALPELDYPKVFEEKMKRIRQLFADRGPKDVQSASYKRFCRENAGVWLDEYAEFCARRDGDKPEFWRWLQWQLDRQFSEVVEYARGKGICFKGDLPIGVSADSADAFWHPELFNLDSSAGAPPDFFSRDGQNWGFPTYNWEEMAKDGYAWWKARLRHMARYFDAFRIDHILGFFRIWEIPVEAGKGSAGHFNPALPYSLEEIRAMGLPLEGLFLPDPRNEGCCQPVITPETDTLEPWQKERFDALYNDFFFHRNDAFWRHNAMRKLPELLSVTGMLACGEDLGMVPDCVNGVMAALGILSLEMAMMDKGRPWPALSVCATSSHDCETLRMQYARGHSGCDMPVSAVFDTLSGHMNSASMLAIFPIQDYLALDSDLRLADFKAERINEPADPKHHWRYRVHFDLNALSGATALCNAVSLMVQASGRQA